jgi:single-strand DNA-binding protein
MADINNGTVVGRLVRDAVLKFTTAGSPVLRGSIAVNKRRKQGNEWVNVGHFFDFVMWGPQAESLSRYLSKGKQIAIAYELNQNRWEEDGKSQSKIELLAHEIQLLSDPSHGQGATPNQGQRRQGGPRASPEDEAGIPPDFPDDIPF